MPEWMWQALRLGVGAVIAIVGFFQVKSARSFVVTGAVIYVATLYTGWWSTFAYLAALAPIVCWHLDDWLGLGDQRARWPGDPVGRVHGMGRCALAGAPPVAAAHRPRPPRSGDSTHHSGDVWCVASDHPKVLHSGHSEQREAMMRGPSDRSPSDHVEQWRARSRTLRLIRHGNGATPMTVALIVLIAAHAFDYVSFLDHDRQARHGRGGEPRRGRPRGAVRAARADRREAGLGGVPGRGRGPRGAPAAQGRGRARGHRHHRGHGRRHLERRLDPSGARPTPTAEARGQRQQHDRRRETCP